MQCSKVAQPIGPYTLGRIIKQPGIGTWGYSSGQIGMHPKTSQLVSPVPAKQAKRALQNLKLVAQSNGFKLSHAVKCNVFLTNMDTFAEVNAVYATFFK